MQLTFQVENAVTAAALLADRLPKTLSDTEKLIYKVLCCAGLEVTKARGYSQHVTEVHFFVPAEVVAVACGIHPSTLYRRLPALRDAGLVDCRGHYCTHNGVTRSDGSVWAVRLTANRGCKAKVPFDYLKKQYRCLGDDIESGRTAFRMLRESKNTAKKSRFNLGDILRFALADTRLQSRSFDSRTVQRFDLETVLDLAKFSAGKEKNGGKINHTEMLEKASKSICVALRDNHSQRFWYGLLKRLLTARERGFGDWFHSLYLLIARCRCDLNEGMADSGGALAVSRLKASGLYELLLE